MRGGPAEDSRFLAALGLESWDTYNNEWARRTETLVPPVLVETGPCKEETIDGDDIDLSKICNVKWHIKDKAAFPAGTLLISVTKDPEDGVHNLGIYRMGIQEKNKMCWGAPASTHGGMHLEKWERLEKPMPMALVTGVEPLIEIAGGVGTSPGADEYTIAGALRGEPVELVKCDTIDINVPATAEWVLEGQIHPDDRQHEVTEWFGEYTGFYGGKLPPSRYSWWSTLPTAITRFSTAPASSGIRRRAITWWGAPIRRNPSSC